MMPHNQWNPELYNRKHAYVFDYGRELVALLAPASGERILDLGCGTGHLTAEIAAREAQVTGLDKSSDMIAVARKQYPEIEFVLGDATDFSFPETFDAVFTNATLHWISDAAAAIRCVAASLKTGGRFVAEFGGRGNVGRIVGALRIALAEIGQVAATERWYNPSVGEFSTLLEKYGLEVSFASLFERPTKLEDGERGLVNWIEMFRGELFQSARPELKRQAIAKVEDKLRGELFHDGAWYADYRRIRVIANKK